jgi:hypothetical protein
MTKLTVALRNFATARKKNQTNNTTNSSRALTNKRTSNCYTSIVDKDVHPSEVVLDPLESRFNIRIFANVTLDRVQFTSLRLQRVGQFLAHSKHRQY